MADGERGVPLVDNDGRLNTTDWFVIGVLLIHAALWFDGEGMPGASAPVWGFPLFGIGVGALALSAWQVRRWFGERQSRGEQP